MSAVFAVIYGILFTLLALAGLGYFIQQLSETEYEEFQIFYGTLGVVSGFTLGTWAIVCFCVACAARESHAAKALLADGVIPPPPNGNPPSVPPCASFATLFAIIDLLIVMALVGIGIWFYTESVHEAQSYSYGYKPEPDTENLVRYLIGAACFGLWTVLLFGHSRACRDTRAVLDRLTGRC